MTDITTLIQKLEQAGEGSREADAWVKCARDGGVRLVIHPPVKFSSEVYFEAFRSDDEQLWMLSEEDIPHYTTSIDAALTLVPEGCCWSIGDSAAGASGWVFDTVTEFSSGGATPALALVIACLKARNNEGA